MLGNIRNSTYKLLIVIFRLLVKINGKFIYSLFSIKGIPYDCKNNQLKDSRLQI